MEITTSPLVRTYTLQEFWDLPEPADHSSLELIRGVLYMTPPPGPPHDEAFDRVVKALIRELDRCGYAGSVYSAGAAIWTDSDTHLEPDLMFVSEALKREMGKERRTRADIVVEIISPSIRQYDRTTKSDTYRVLGVSELWLMDPESREVEVRSFEAGKTQIFRTTEQVRSEVLAGIEIPVSDLFD